MSESQTAAQAELVKDREKERAASRAGTELEEYLIVSEQRRRLFPRAALVGLGAGLLAVAFRFLLQGGEETRERLYHLAHGWGAAGIIAPALFSALTALLAVALSRIYAPETAGSGIPHLKSVLHRIRDQDWRRVILAKLLGGTLAIGGGLALGREGPTLQMAGATGDAVGRLLKSPVRERLTLIAAGAGAGLAAAFNAPLAGLVFVLEEVQRDFRRTVFGAAFLAAAVADVVTRVACGQDPIFDIPAYAAPPVAALPAFALLGAVAGALGVVFNKSLLAGLRLFAPLKGGRLLAAAGGVGALVGVTGWWFPDLIGTGHHLAERVLHGEMALALVPAYFLARYALTMASYSSGAPGGIFAPLLVLGSMIGLGFGQVTDLLAPDLVPEAGVFGVVGMAAYFTGIVRAPLTGVVLIVEMTGSYELMLPLLAACFCAYAAANALRDLPIYEALLQRDLRNNPSGHFLAEPIVLELEVEAGSPFEGRRVRDLGLPPGCILLRVTDGAHESIPQAESRLPRFARVTAVVAPEASEGVTILRRGCAGAHSG
jgi:CIC family chloride channel protein